MYVVGVIYQNGHNYVVKAPLSSCNLRHIIIASFYRVMTSYKYKKKIS